MLPVVFFLIVLSSLARCSVKLSTNTVTMHVGETATFNAQITNSTNNSCEMLSFLIENGEIVRLRSDNATNKICSVRLEAIKEGKSAVSASAIKSTGKKVFLLVKVHKNSIIEWISIIMGWMYFLAWSVSFYPQIYTNYKRKSVVGLNFDFLLFNIVGYVVYNIFIMGLYFIPEIKEQYSARHPKSLIPVQPNDIFFSSHGILATAMTIIQCFLYESGDQKVSTPAKLIVAVLFYFLEGAVSLALANLNIVQWLDVLYVCSYIKLCVTVKKYVPQVYMNWKRNSTQGWSIGGIMLDFTGGILSILQMILDGYNYGDWTIIIENPTKFGLGILTIGFDLVFTIQHYVLYAKDETDLEIQGKYIENKVKEEKR